MEVKPSYPVPYPERNLALLERKGRKNELGAEGPAAIANTADIVDITPDDIIHIDAIPKDPLPKTQPSNPLRKTIFSQTQVKGSVIDIWI